MPAANSNPSFLPGDTPTRYNFALQALHLVQAQYLKAHKLLSAHQQCCNELDCRNLACIQKDVPECRRAKQDKVVPGESLLLLDSLRLPSPSFNLLSDCGFQPLSISKGCMNITTRAQFQRQVPAALTRIGARRLSRRPEHSGKGSMPPLLLSCQSEHGVQRRPS